MKTILIAFMLAISLSSCSVYQTTSGHYPDEVNKHIINKLRKTSLNQEGNCFVATSTYSRSAYLWYYTDRTIEIYSLQNGRIIAVDKYLDEGKSKFSMIYYSENSFSDLDGWILVLDGDGLEINLREQKIKVNIPTSIRESIKNSQFRQPLFNLVVSDIIKYNLMF